MGDDLIMLELLATACSGLFAGAAVYISAVQHPATLQTGATMAVSFFPAMYRRAAPVQAGLAAVGTGAALLAWLGGSGVLWLLGALLLGFVLPFTVLAIKPVNDQLLAASLDPAAPETGELLWRWGVLHSVRSASSAIAFLLFLLA